jgi:hypothetical protein
MVGPVGIGAWNWLSTDEGAVEVAVVVAGETGVRVTGISEAGVSEARTVGVGKTEAEKVAKCACVVEPRVGRSANECAESEAALPTAHGS